MRKDARVLVNTVAPFLAAIGAFAVMDEITVRTLILSAVTGLTFGALTYLMWDEYVNGR